MPRSFCVAACSLAWVAAWIGGGLGSTSLFAAPILWNTGDGNWDVAANWSPQRVPGENDDATIAAGASVLVNNGGFGKGEPTPVGTLQCAGNLTVEPVWVGNWTRLTRLKVFRGGEISGKLTMLPGAVLWTTGGTFRVTGSTDMQGGSLWVYGGSTLDMAGLTGLTACDDYHFYATDAGSLLNLANLATITAPESAYWNIDLEASGGARVIAGTFTMDAGTASRGWLSLLAYDAVSLVDVSAMTPLPGPMDGGWIEVADQGTVRLPETYTNLDNHTLTIFTDGRIQRPDGSDAMRYFTSLAHGYLGVYERNIPDEAMLGSPNLSGITNINGTEIELDYHGELELPGVTSLTVGETYAGPYYTVGHNSRLDLSAITQIQSVGEWESWLNVYGGSVLDMRGVSEIPGLGYFCIDAWDNDTVVDFSSLVRIGSSACIMAQGGATVILGDRVELAGEENFIGVWDGGSLVMGQLVVGEGTYLGGSGDLGTDLFNAGMVAPGESPGTLVVDDYIQAATGTLEIELAGTIPGEEYDVLDVRGEAQLDGLLSVLVDDSLEIEPDMAFWVLRTDALSGIFTGLPEGAVAWSETGGDGDRLFISYRDSGVFLLGALAEVPEPSSVAMLLALGALILAPRFRRWRR